MAEKKSFEYVEQLGKSYPLERNNGKLVVTVNGQKNLYDTLEHLKSAGYELKKGHNQGALLTEDGNLDLQGVKLISNQTRPEVRLQA